eukprot:TRINITY_DN66964_c8_g2_i1.p1 TRINITY_DN66964_c8_g2~~TRINITY_DN66964_c8_g2_i1.p1  ORF type:complete len:373 (+),score=34.55 TRINITY_DN66964_c8_g2_i1:516-1634(+)
MLFVAKVFRSIPTHRVTDGLIDAMTDKCSVDKCKAALAPSCGHIVCAHCFKTLCCQQTDLGQLGSNNGRPHDSTTQSSQLSFSVSDEKESLRRQIKQLTERLQTLEMENPTSSTASLATPHCENKSAILQTHTTTVPSSPSCGTTPKDTDHKEKKMMGGGGGFVPKEITDWFEASRLGDVNKMKEVLAAFCEQWKKNNPLQHVVKSPSASCGVDVDPHNCPLLAAVDDRYGMTALLWAAEAGQLSVVTWLVQHGLCEISGEKERDKVGNTALLLAAKGGHVEVVEWLIKRANCNAREEKDKYGYTALMKACRGGELDIVKWLVEGGYSDPAVEQDKVGNTALVLAKKAPLKVRQPVVDYLSQHLFQKEKFRK